MKIALRHGAGGEETSKLIHGIFATYFQNDILNKMEDAAVLPKLIPIVLWWNRCFSPEEISESFLFAERSTTWPAWEQNRYILQHLLFWKRGWTAKRWKKLLRPWQQRLKKPA